MTSSRLAARQAVDLGALDHLPACPSCGDLNRPGALVCGVCRAYLYPRRFDRSTVTRPSVLTARRGL